MIATTTKSPINVKPGRLRLAVECTTGLVPLDIRPIIPGYLAVARPIFFIDA
jgi:hypothetical protein